MFCLFFSFNIYKNFECYARFLKNCRQILILGIFHFIAEQLKSISYADRMWKGNKVGAFLYAKFMFSFLSMNHKTIDDRVWSPHESIINSWRHDTRFMPLVTRLCTFLFLLDQRGEQICARNEVFIKKNFLVWFFVCLFKERKWMFIETTSIRSKFWEDLRTFRLLFCVQVSFIATDDFAKTKTGQGYKKER